MPSRPDLISLPSAVNEVAVISPCTKCKNRRTTHTAEGFWPCPRKVWEEREKHQNVEHSVPSYLTVSGTNNGSLRNPVYSEKHRLILVWTASLVDNCGLYKHNSQDLITPDILDPNFDTAYIKCAEMPSLVFETQSSYYQDGAYKEGETVVKFGVQPFQVTASDEPFYIQGFVKRVDVAFNTSFATPDEDVIISGM